MATMQVYVSAAQEELEYEREIAVRVIESLNLEAIRFEGLLTAGPMVPDSELLDQVRRCDIVVLILWKGIPLQVMQEFEEAVRRQKPILVFVKMLKDSEDRQQSLTDLLKSVKADQEGPVQTRVPFVRCFQHYRSLGELEGLLRSEITAEINRQLKYTITMTLTRQEMYELGTQIILAAKRRLYVVQQTPILLLGAREYSAPPHQKIWYESKYLKALSQWIEDCRHYPNRECVFLYHPEITRTDISAIGLGTMVKKELLRLKQLELETEYRFRILPLLSKHSGPMTVGDNWFAIWVMGEHNAVAISYVNEQVSEALVRVLQPAGSRISSAEAQLEQLGISSD